MAANPKDLELFSGLEDIVGPIGNDNPDLKLFEGLEDIVGPLGVGSLRPGLPPDSVSAILSRPGSSAAPGRADKISANVAADSTLKPGLWDAAAQARKTADEATRLRSGLSAGRATNWPVPTEEEAAVSRVEGLPVPTPATMQARRSATAALAASGTRAVAHGLAGVARGVGGTLEVMEVPFPAIPGQPEPPSVGRALGQVAEVAMEATKPRIEGDLLKEGKINWDLVSNPTWWVERGGQTLGSIAAFVASGAAGQRAALATLGPKFASVAPQIGGVLGAALGDAVIEGGNLYRTLIARGTDKEQARAESSKLAAKNFGLTALTSGLAFFGAPAAKEFAEKGVRWLTGTVAEITQEVFQEKMSSEVLGEKLTASQALEVGLFAGLGAQAIGPGAGVVTRVAEKRAREASERQADAATAARIAAASGLPGYGLAETRTEADRPFSKTEAGAIRSTEQARLEAKARETQEVRTIAEAPVPGTRPTTTRQTADLIQAQKDRMHGEATRLSAPGVTVETGSDQHAELLDAAQGLGILEQDLVRMTPAEVQEEIRARIGVPAPPVTAREAIVRMGGIDMRGTRWSKLGLPSRKTMLESGLVNDGGESPTRAMQILGLKDVGELAELLKSDEALDRPLGARGAEPEAPKPAPVQPKVVEPPPQAVPTAAEPQKPPAMTRQIVPPKAEPHRVEIPESVSQEYVAAVRATDDYLDTLVEKYGTDQVVIKPEKFLDKEELLKLNSLYDRTQAIGEKDDKAVYDAVVASLSEEATSGPAGMDMVRAVIADVQKDVNRDMAMGRPAGRDVRKLTEDVFVSLSHKLAYENKFPIDLVGDFQEAVRVARDWPNTIYGENPAPLLKQSVAIARDLVRGMPKKAEKPTLDVPEVPPPSVAEPSVAPEAKPAPGKKPAFAEFYEQRTGKSFMSTEGEPPPLAEVERLRAVYNRAYGAEPKAEGVPVPKKRGIRAIMDEPIAFGGEVLTRAEALKEMQAEKQPKGAIDIFVFKPEALTPEQVAERGGLKSARSAQAEGAVTEEKPSTGIEDVTRDQILSGEVELDIKRDKHGNIVSATRREIAEKLPEVEGRSAKIEAILKAAEVPMPEIVQRTETKASNGKWYSGFLPEGLQWTDEKRSYFVYMDHEGSTYGNGFNTREEAEENHRHFQAGRTEEFRQELNKMSDEKIQRQSDYWLGLRQKEQLAAKAAKQIRAKEEVPAVRFGPGVLGTGSAEDDARLRDYRAKKKAGRPMTTTEEHALQLYEARAKADPGKWKVGDGVGYKVMGSGGKQQINRGFRIREIDPETKTAVVVQVADTGITQTGGADRIAPQWFHVASLVRDKKYDAPRPQQGAPAASERPVRDLNMPIGGWPAPKEIPTRQDDPLNGFMAGEPPLKIGKAKKALDQHVMNKGEPITRKDLVEGMVEGGATIRLSPKGTRRLFNVDESFLDEAQISKTAMDYAEHLIAKHVAEAPPAEVAEGPPQIAETPAKLRARNESGLNEEERQIRRSIAVAEKKLQKQGAMVPEPIRQTTRDQIQKLYDRLDAIQSERSALYGAPPAAPAEAAKPAEAEQARFVRTTPAKGTPEREALDKEHEELDNRRTELYGLRDELQKQIGAATYGSNKETTLKRKLEKVDTEYDALSQKAKTSDPERRNRFLEDVIETGDEANRIAALAERDGEKGGGYEKVLPLAEDEARRQGVEEERVGGISRSAALSISNTPGLRSLAEQVKTEYNVLKQRIYEDKSIDDIDAMENLSLQQKDGYKRNIRDVYGEESKANIVAKARAFNEERGRKIEEAEAEVEADRQKRLKAADGLFAGTPGTPPKEADFILRPPMASQEERGIETLKGQKDKVPVTNAEGETEFQTTTRFGPFATVKQAGRFKIVHIPSGIEAAEGVAQKDAKRLIYRLINSGIDWNFKEKNALSDADKAKARGIIDHVNIGTGREPGPDEIVFGDRQWAMGYDALRRTLGDIAKADPDFVRDPVVTVTSDIDRKNGRFEVEWRHEYPEEGGKRSYKFAISFDPSMEGKIPTVGQTIRISKDFLEKIGLPETEAKKPGVFGQIKKLAGVERTDLLRIVPEGFISQPPRKSPHAFPDQEIEAEYRDSNIKEPTISDQIVTALDAFRKSWRDYPELEYGSQYGPLREWLRQLGHQKGVASHDAIERLAAIAETIRKSPDDFDLFSRKVYLDDLAYEDSEGRILPHGWTSEKLAEARQENDAKFEATQAVAEAVAERRRVWDALKVEYAQAMSDIGFNVEDRFKNPNYFRHQVLEYVQTKGIFGTGQKLKTPSSRSFLKGRAGYAGAYNVNYLEAEYEVLSQMLYDMQVAKTIKLIRDQYDIAPQLKQQARAHNENSLMDIFREQAETVEPTAKQIRDAAEEGMEIPEFIARSLYRQTLNVSQAIGFSHLQKLAIGYEDESGNIHGLPEDSSGRWDDVVDALANAGLTDETYPDLFRYLGWILSEHPQTEAGQAAALIFKGIGFKKAFTKEKLTEIGQYRTWRDMVPEDHTRWQPREGNLFYLADTISAQVATRIMEQASGQAVSPSQIRKALAMGGPRTEYVIPAPAALTLDNIQRSAPMHSAVGSATSWGTRQLKRIWLYGTGTVRYGLRNLTGDLDITFVGNPKALLRSKQAVEHVWNGMIKNKFSPEFRAFYQRGGGTSTLQVQELGEVNQLEPFIKMFRQRRSFADIPADVWNGYWRTVRLGHDFRESIMRFANFLEYRDQIRKGKGKPQNYGASLPEEIDALTDSDDKAFRLANELVGAYDEVSMSGRELREHIYPFWSWVEVNMRRYYRLAKNVSNDRSTTTQMGKALGATSLRVAFRLGSLALMAVALRSLTEAWNNLVFPDEEDELPDYVRERAHLVLGRSDDGKVRYFSRMGALDDALEWFGLAGAPRHVQNYLSGRRTLSEIGEDIWKTPVNKFASGLGIGMIAAEVLTGRELYPDLFRPRGIRDRGLYIARTLGVETAYREAMDLPTRGFARSLESIPVYYADPLEQGYNAIYDAKFRYLKRIGKEKEGGGWWNDRSSALYNMRLAARYGDREAQARYLKKYAELGGTPSGVEKSFEMMHPTSGLSREDLPKFIASLDGEQKEQLARAVRFYNEIILGTNIKALVWGHKDVFGDTPQFRDDLRSRIVDLQAQEATAPKGSAERTEARKQKLELLQQAGGLAQVKADYRDDLNARRQKEGEKPMNMGDVVSEWNSRVRTRIGEWQKKRRALKKARTSTGFAEPLLRAAD